MFFFTALITLAAAAFGWLAVDWLVEHVPALRRRAPKA